MAASAVSASHRNWLSTTRPGNGESPFTMAFNSAVASSSSHMVLSACTNANW